MIKAPLTPSKPDSELDLPEFTFSELVRAAKLPSGTVKMWIERSILKLGTFDIQSQGKGSARMFTLRTVYLAATMAEITRLGVSPSQAAKWAHVIWRMGADRMVAPQEDMVFVGSPASDRFRIARRSGLSDEVIFADLPATEAPELSVVVIDVSGVVRKCREALGLPEQIGRF